MQLCSIELFRIDPYDILDHNYGRRKLIWYDGPIKTGNASTTIYVRSYDTFDTIYVQAQLNPLKHSDGFHAGDINDKNVVGFRIRTGLLHCKYNVRSKHPSDAWDDINGQGTDLWISTMSTTRSRPSWGGSTAIDGLRGALGMLLFGGPSTSADLALLVGFNPAQEGSESGRLHGAVQLMRLEPWISGRPASWQTMQLQALFPKGLVLRAHGLSYSRIKIPTQGKTITAQFDVIRKEHEGMHIYEIGVYTQP